MHKQALLMEAALRPITIRIPARAAYDLDSLQKVVVNLAERLGHPNCLSGANCLFSLERDFLVNPANLAIESVSEGMFMGR